MGARVLLSISDFADMERPARLKGISFHDSVKSRDAYWNIDAVGVSFVITVLLDTRNGLRHVDNHSFNEFVTPGF